MSGKRKRREGRVTLAGLAVSVEGLVISAATLAAAIERVAALVVEQSNFLRDQMREEFRAETGELRGEVGELRGEMRAKFLAVHNRLDDILLNRATRDDLAATNVRVSRLEGHLGLA